MSGRQPPFRTKQRKVQQQQPQIATSPPVLLFHGTVLNEFMEPLPNAWIQFWQADIHGNYAHPGNEFPQHAEGGQPHELLTDSFSYFGTATTDIKGHFSFRTYRPGIYTSRPITHIHYKVFSNTTITTNNNDHSQQQQQQQPQLLLTSQFYFDDENVNGLLAGYDDRQFLKLEEADAEDEDHEDKNEDPSRLFWTTTKTIVVNAMARTSLTERGQQYLSNAATNNNKPHMTPWDVEGPFYPVVEFWDVGNDLTVGLIPTVPVPITNQEDNEDEDIDGDDATDDNTIPKQNVEETEKDDGIKLSTNTTIISSNDVTVGNEHQDSNDNTTNVELDANSHNDTNNDDNDNTFDVTSCVPIGTSDFDKYPKCNIYSVIPFFFFHFFRS